MAILDDETRLDILALCPACTFAVKRGGGILQKGCGRFEMNARDATGKTGQERAAEAGMCKAKIVAK